MIWLLGGYMWLFIHRPFEVWPVLGDLRLERVYMIAVLGVWAFSRKHWTPNLLNGAFACFTLSLLASWFLSDYSALGTPTVENYLKVAIFSVLVLSSVRSQRDLKRLLVMYLAAVALYMAHSLWEFHNGRYEWRMNTIRMIGVDLTYGDSNTFAATLLYSLPLTYAFWTGGGLKRVHVALLSAYTLLTLICILLTGSRTALAGLCFLALLASVVFEPLRARWKLWAPTAVLIALVTWQALPSGLKNRYLTLIDPSYGPSNAQESAESRWHGWRDGVRIWRENPVFGVGPRAFGKARGYQLESHHLYGQVLGEMGSLGAVALALIVFGFVRNSYRLARRARAYPPQMRGFEYRLVTSISMVVALMLMMGFGGHNLYRYTWMWFGTFQVLAYAQASASFRRFDKYMAAALFEQALSEPAEHHAVAVPPRSALPAEALSFDPQENQRWTS